MSFGKKTVGNTSAAAVPYRKKSYHSMLVPASAVSATLTIDFSGAPAGASALCLVASRDDDAMQRSPVFRARRGAQPTVIPSIGRLTPSSRSVEAGPFLHVRLARRT